MDLETLIKYLIWVVLFVMVLAGLYFMLRKFGVI
jgi:hypothetical protein